MRRLPIVVLVVLLVSALLVGCGGGEVQEPEEQQEQEAGDQAEVVKTGLAVQTVLNKSADAGENPGLAQTDSTVVAVMVDGNDKIIKCVIEAVQSKINFDENGEVTTPVDTMFLTKTELGDEYGMRVASDIGREWDEQAASLAEYVEGKTLDEIKAIAVDEGSYPTDSDLTATVTMAIGGYLDTLETAVAQAQELGASASDELSIGVTTTMKNSVSAEDDKPGLAEAYSTYVAITKDAEDKITSCVVDSSQGKVNFDTSGKITSDIEGRVKSKKELGDDYGMRGTSDIGKEWDEQANAFAEYVTGKTPSEVAGIAVDDEGHPTDSDLTSSVTMAIGDLQSALAKAAEK
ncbi:MAG: hypothetical protein GX318_05780 [Clostridia bacterium]|nr:hypothetical protein [Clostridia bacterium]